MGHIKAKLVLLSVLIFFGISVVTYTLVFTIYLIWLTATQLDYEQHVFSTLLFMILILPSLPLYGLFQTVLFASLPILVGTTLAATATALTKHMQLWMVLVIAIPCTAVFQFQFTSVMNFDPVDNPRSVGNLLWLPLASLLGSWQLFHVVLRRRRTSACTDNPGISGS